MLPDGSWNWIGEKEYRGKVIILHGLNRKQKDLSQRRKEMLKEERYLNVSLNGSGCHPKHAMPNQKQD
jgi:hypothetical protein